MVKNLPANAGDSGSVPGSERSPGEGNSCLENPMDRGAWWAAALGITNDLGIKQQQRIRLPPVCTIPLFFRVLFPSY